MAAIPDRKQVLDRETLKAAMSRFLLPGLAPFTLPLYEPIFSLEKSRLLTTRVST